MYMYVLSLYFVINVGFKNSQVLVLLCNIYMIYKNVCIDYK
jgi:hypothetical protein